MGERAPDNVWRGTRNTAIVVAGLTMLVTLGIMFIASAGWMAATPLPAAAARKMCMAFPCWPMWVT